MAGQRSFCPQGQQADQGFPVGNIRFLSDKGEQDLVWHGQRTSCAVRPWTEDEVAHADQWQGVVRPRITRSISVYGDPAALRRLEVHIAVPLEAQEMQVELQVAHQGYGDAAPSGRDERFEGVGLAAAYSTGPRRSQVDQFASQRQRRAGRHGA